MSNKRASDAFAVDIGHSHITATRLVTRDGQMLPSCFAQVGLPPGTLDQYGRVADHDTLVAGLRRVTKLADPKSKYVRLAASGHQLQLHHFRKPRELDFDSLSLVVEHEVKHTASGLGDAAVVTVVALDDYDDELVNVMAIVGHRDHLGKFRAVVEDAGLKLASIEPEPLELIRSIDVGRGDNADLLLSIGMHSSNIVVVQNNIVRHWSVIESGGDACTEALVERCGYSPAVAEHFKRTSSLLAAEDGSDPYPAEREALQMAAEGYVDAVHQGLMWSREDRIEIDRIVICGGGALLSGLAFLLREVISKPVYVAKPAPGLVVRDHANFPAHSLAYSLAMPDTEASG